MLGCMAAILVGCASNPPASTVGSNHPDASTASSPPLVQKPVDEMESVETCVTKQVAEPVGAEANAEQDKSSVRRLSVIPAVGSAVTPDTVLTVDLAYHVSGFSEGQFKATAQFDTTRAGMTMDGTFNDYPILIASSGTLRFCFPLRHIWNEPLVAKPLVVRIYLTRRSQGNTSDVVAQSESWSYPIAGAVNQDGH